MKKTGFIVSALSLVIGASAQNTRINNFNGRFTENSKEVIRDNAITREHVYSYTFNKKGIKDSSLSKVFYYDAAGNLIEEQWGKVITKYSNSFDPSGRLQRQISTREELNLVTILEYEYDSLGNEVTRYAYNKDTTRLTVEQKVYNEKTQVVQLLTTFNDRPQYISRRYYYSPDNNLVKTEALDQKGNVIYSYIYEYDKSQNRKTVYLENSEGKKKIEEFFYNNEMQIVKAYSTSKRPSLISQDGIQTVDLEQRTENIYNSDKTIFESVIYVEGKKAEMIRHYYFKQ